MLKFVKCSIVMTMNSTKLSLKFSIKCCNKIFVTFVLIVLTQDNFTKLHKFSLDNLTCEHKGALSMRERLGCQDSLYHDLIRTPVPRAGRELS